MAVEGVRARARQALTADIKAEATRQLAADGAAALSLRSVARSLGLASSAIYRYFPSRDALLTALITDAYNDLGATVERAVAEVDPGDLEGRWMAAGRAVRGWAQAEPHRYALLYGSPVPGFAAPESTIAPATRVPLVLAQILADGWAAEELRPPEATGDLPASLLEVDLAQVVASLGEVPPEVVLRGLMAWSQLFGLVSFELFGHFVGSVADADAFFDAALRVTGQSLGLRPRP